MAGSIDPAYADFIPYDPNLDPLQGDMSYDKVCIEGIPPSAARRDSGAARNVAPLRGRATETTQQKKSELSRYLCT